MVGIWEFPDLAGLERYIEDVVDVAKQRASDKPTSEARFIPSVSLSRIIVAGEWGNGTAEIGDDELVLALFFSFRGPDETLDDILDVLNNSINEVIIDEVIEPPEQVRSTFTGVNSSTLNIENINNTLVQMSVSDLDTVFDLSNLELIDLKEAEPPDQYPRVPLEELVDVKEEPTDEEPEQTPSVSISDQIDEEPALLPRLEELDVEEEDTGPEFPEINPNLRPFAVSEDKLEIPAGKETKEIEPREPYDFEIEMALPGTNTSSSVVQKTIETIGLSMERDRFGNEDAAGTFPRTGVYIRNYLKFREPAYTYEIYKNLVFYSAYISSLHDINVRTGEYKSFREYIYVLKEIPERGGPKLIEPLSQPQAAAQGLETIADHPTIEDAKAPWLEKRQYYTLIEENDESDVWRNPYDYLHNRDSSDE